MTPQPSAFKIDSVSIGLGNFDHYNQPAFAEASVELGAFRFRAFMHPDGTVCLPASLHDKQLRVAIAIALRGRVLTECHRAWRSASELDERLLRERSVAAA
jgi:hypothetical protein